MDIHEYEPSTYFEDADRGAAQERARWQAGLNELANAMASAAVNLSPSQRECVDYACSVLRAIRDRET